MNHDGPMLGSRSQPFTTKAMFAMLRKSLKVVNKNVIKEKDEKYNFFMSKLRTETLLFFLFFQY